MIAGWLAIVVVSLQYYHICLLRCQVMLLLITNACAGSMQLSLSFRHQPRDEPVYEVESLLRIACAQS